MKVWIFTAILIVLNLISLVLGSFLDSYQLWECVHFLALIQISGVLIAGLFSVVRRNSFFKIIGAFAACCLLMAIALFNLVIAGAKIAQLSQPETNRPSSVILPDNLIDVRGQIHVHSCRSHDSKGTLEEIVKAAKTSGVRWIILTDHKAKYRPSVTLNGVLIIFGKESNWKSQGSYLRAPLRDDDCFRAYGHLEQFSDWKNNSEWDAIEIVNFHANARQKRGRLIKQLFLNPSSLNKELIYVLPENSCYWQALSEQKEKPIPIFAGTDAHSNFRIFGIQLDPYDWILRLASTHIFLESSAELKEEAIIKAIKKGRTYVAFDVLGDPMGFQFIAEAAGRRHLTGDTVNQPNKLIIKNPLTDGTEIMVFRNNRLVSKKADAAEIVIDDPQSGFWRVEIYRNGSLWILSGQILVK